jgi:pentatricopeptide repeat protein
MAVHTESFSGAYLLGELARAFWSVRAEIFIFIAAFCAHALLFGKYRLVPRKQEASKNKSPSRRPATVDNDKPKKAQMTADDICKRTSGKPEDVLASLRRHLQGAGPEVSSALQILLQGAGRTPQAEFLAAANTIAKESSLPLNNGLGEMLLRGYYTCHLDSQFDTLLADIEAEAKNNSQVLAGSVGIQALKRTLKKGEFEASLKRLAGLRNIWEEGTPSAAPKALIQWLARLAVQQKKIPEMVKEVKNFGLLGEAFPLILSECAQHGNSKLLRETEALGRKEGLDFNDAAYCALLKSDADLEHAMKIFSEAVAGASATKELIAAASSVAHAHKSVTFADMILKKLEADSCVEVAGKLLQVYAQSSAGDAKVLDLYLKYYSKADLSGDAATEQQLAEACIRSNRHDLLQQILTTTTDSTKRVALIKHLGAAKRIDDALVVFHAYPNKGACLYNAIIDVCYHGDRQESAKEVMREATNAGTADIVTYNTIIKAHLLAGKTAEAQQTVQLMKDAGLQPNCVTFNELLDSCVRQKVTDFWQIFSEMEACGVKPNHITGSILLKTIKADTPASNVERVLEVLDGMVEDMDEVLLSSVVEACIRAGRVDLLVPHLRRQTSSKRIQVHGPHTYGSMIRAYGYVNDIAGAWETWREMRRRHIAPTAVTLGCMVEAVVSNGDPEAGYELIQEVRADEQCRSLVNAVIYCSVLKGFSHLRKFDRVWEVYQEVLAQKLQFSIVTFNTMIDACSRSGRMNHISALLESMVSQGIEPNLITYSAILKGYCQENQIEEAFSLMEACRTKFAPDEVMYNTLLDGCARQGLYDRGMTLLADMESYGIKPSNFTLSVLVKLCTRAKKTDSAFEIVRDISRKYNFKPNCHVYSNLIQACIQHKDLARAFDVLDKCINEKVRPEVRTYSLLLRACISARHAQDAAGLIRAAVGLRGVHPNLMGHPPALLQPKPALPAALIAEVLEGISGQCGEERLAVALLKDLHTKTNVKLDPKLQMRLTTHAVGNTR